MAIFSNNAEGGTANTTATSANTGGVSGDAFTAIAPDVQFKSDIVAFGDLSYGIGSGASDGTARWALGDTSKVTSGRYYFYYSAAVSSQLTLATVKGASDATTVINIYFTSLGNVRFGKGGGSNYWTSTWNISSNLGEWLYIDWEVNTGTSASDGTAQVRISRMVDNSVLADSGVITNNFGAGVLLSNARIFMVGAPTGYSGTMRWDMPEVHTDVDVDGLIGPASTVFNPPVPVANNRPRYLIDYSGSTAAYSGTLSFAIEQTSGATVSPEDISDGVWAIPQSVDEPLSFTVTISEASAGDATDDITVPKVAAGDIVNVSAPLAWSGTDWA